MAKQRYYNSNNNYSNNNNNVISNNNMTITYRQARAILFGLSTLSLLTSFLLVLFMPNLVDVANTYEDTVDMFDERNLIGKHDEKLIRNNIMILSPPASSTKRIQQQHENYLPNELHEIMLKQSEIHEQQEQQQQLQPLTHDVPNNDQEQQMERKDLERVKHSEPEQVVLKFEDFDQQQEKEHLKQADQEPVKTTTIIAPTTIAPITNPPIIEPTIAITTKPPVAVTVDDPYSIDTNKVLDQQINNNNNNVAANSGSSGYEQPDVHELEIPHWKKKSHFSRQHIEQIVYHNETDANQQVDGSNNSDQSNNLGVNKDNNLEPTFATDVNNNIPAPTNRIPSRDNNNIDSAINEFEDERIIQRSKDHLFMNDNQNPKQSNGNIGQPRTLFSDIPDISGIASSSSDNANLFVVLADSRSGSDWIMNLLNDHSAICSSSKIEHEMYTRSGHKVLVGGYPTGALLLPHGLAWMEDTNIVKSCTLAFVQEQIPKMVRHLIYNADGISIPRSCKEINSDNPLYTNHILERLCSFIIHKLNGSYTKQSISKAYIDSYIHALNYDERSTTTDEEEAYDFGCVCPPGTKVRGLKVMTNWFETLPIFNYTSLHGSKIIRLHRTSNYFAQYMSFVIANITNVWSMNDLATKREQFQKFHEKYTSVKYTIDINDMIREIQNLQDKHLLGNDIAYNHGSKIVYINYDHCRDDTYHCVQRILQFLNMNDNVDRHDARFNTLLASLSSSPFSEYNSGTKLLNEYIQNSDIVQEVLIANGWGDFLKGDMQQQSLAGKYTQIQHIIYDYDNVVGNDDDMNQRKKLRISTNAMMGINTQYVKNIRINDSKFSSLHHILQSMEPDTLVVISNGDSDSMDHHIRTNMHLYESLAQFRASFQELISSGKRTDGTGTVVVAADSRCCVRALTHAKPGDFFSKIDGKRMNRSCSIPSKDEIQQQGSGCSWAGDQYALPWQMFMKVLALDRSDSQSSTSISNVYLDATLIGGSASDLIRLFREADIAHTEDVHAVLTDFMYYDKSRIVLDYEGKIFGKTFEGVRNKVQTYPGCVGGGENIDFDEDEDEFHDSYNYVRPLFLSGRRDLQCSVPTLAIDDKNSLPIWDAAGIKIKPIMDHIDRFFIQRVSLPGILKSFGSEVLYVVDNDNIWVSRRKQDSSRFNPSNKFIKLAHEELMGDKGASDRWSLLKTTVQSVGFPYWAWYGDFKGCNDHNFGEESVPLFTTCARSDCRFAFPTPSFSTIINAKSDVGSWYSLFQKFDEEYPWESKIRKAVWRGTLLEDDPDRVFDNVRWRLLKLVQDQSLDLFDVGLTDVPSSLSQHVHIDTSAVGGLKPRVKSTATFQRHLAIIDMDGNTWSSQFVELLCYNSVVIKVDPTFVDYLYYDLKPWKHFIPVKSDLSDLNENVAFAMDSRNDAIVKDIIASANQVCVERFVLKELAHDLLDIWEYYVQKLDASDSNWKQLWADKKSSILSSKLYDLVHIDSLIR